MPLSAALQRFVADELARMPALIEQVRRQTADALRQPAPGLAPASAAERMLRFDIAQALDQHARRFSDTFIAALAQRLQNDSAAAGTEAPPATVRPRGLALIDEAAHSADIEIARVATLVGSAAEWELRELQTFTSALGGLPYVSVTSNPFRPEAFAHALWQAADALPPARSGPLLLRTAASVLAEALRRAWAAACTRLEDQGVEPSLYRTAVPTPVERASVLADLLDTVPSKVGERPDDRDDTAAGRLASGSASEPNADLLRSLFDAIARGSQMHPALRALTALVQSSAIGLAARDAALLDNANHPLWQMLDRFAYQSATHPNPADPQWLAWVGFATELVAALHATPMHEAQHYRSSVEQLDAYSAAQFNAQLQQASADIEALRRDAPGDTPLDVASLDTVPADLLAGAAPAEADAAAATWLDQQTPGGWYRMFLRGRWNVMRLLWHSDSRARWLFAGPYAQRNDAFDRAALVRLRAEVLVRPLVERAIVVRAAESVRRRLADPRPAA